MQIPKGCLIVLGVCLLWVGNACAQDSLFPSIPGWHVSADERVYDPNDLWDIIDGAADLYLECAFVDLRTARYSTESRRVVKAELYRHRDAENAFGIYSAERNPEYNFIPIGSQGYQQSSVLNFLAGEFYVKLSSYQSDRESADDLLAVATGIEKHLKRTAALPAVLRLFPMEGKQPNNEQFVALNFLGYGFFRSVYTASYGGSAPFKAFIIEKKSEEDADTTMNEYFLNVPKENIHSQGNNVFIVRDTNNGAVSIAHRGRFVYGTLNCTDEQRRNEFFAAIEKNISTH